MTTTTTDKFKDCMAQLASGVTVITTIYEDNPVGITASSFTSLSADPPLVMINVHKNLFTHKAISESGVFAVNLLNAFQLDLGMRFAGMVPEFKEDRFAGLDTFTAETGCQILPDVLAWFDCKIWEIYEGGDHSIFVGEVVDMNVGDTDVPLLYHNRIWRRSEALDSPTIPLEAHLVDVGLRDGIQREEKYIPVDMKVELAKKLVDAGIKNLQVTSFVHPKLVPQMADAEEVVAKLPKVDDVTYSGLVLNMKGLERAHAAGVTHIDMGVAASDILSRKNANVSTEEGMENLKLMITQAQEWGMRVRGGVQSAFGHIEEPVDPKKIVGMARQILSWGVDELSIADSAGLANPQQVRRMVQELLPMSGDIPMVMHFHDTRGMGLANLLSALKSGARHFDTSFGGLGGCPFIPQAAGNIATEDSVNMLESMGVRTGVDIAKVAQATAQVEEFLGTALPAKVRGDIAVATN